MSSPNIFHRSPSNRIASRKRPCRGVAFPERRRRDLVEWPLCAPEAVVDGPAKQVDARAVKRARSIPRTSSEPVSCGSGRPKAERTITSRLRGATSGCVAGPRGRPGERPPVTLGLRLSFPLQDTAHRLSSLRDRSAFDDQDVTVHAVGPLLFGAHPRAGLTVAFAFSIGNALNV